MTVAAAPQEGHVGNTCRVTSERSMQADGRLATWTWVPNAAVLDNMPAFLGVTVLPYQDALSLYLVIPYQAALHDEVNELPEAYRVIKYPGVKMHEVEHLEKRKGNDASMETNNKAHNEEEEEVSLMQRKRRRSQSPRRRRREREARDNERLRQERRSAWTIRPAGERVITETSSRKPLVAPWQRGGGRNAGTSRPSSAPSTSSCHRVPDVPPLGNGSANVVWWVEILGLQDAMGDNNRVLDEQTVEAVINNLRDMEPHRRTVMISQLLPFLGCFLTELLRAINLAQLPHDDAEPEYIEDDEAALLQLGGSNFALDSDQVSMVQTYDPRVPFGSKLTQTQARTQCAQAAWHLRVMTARLRRLAGTMTVQVSDRFLRLEALVATYVTEKGGGTAFTTSLE